MLKNETRAETKTLKPIIAGILLIVTTMFGLVLASIFFMSAVTTPDLTGTGTLTGTIYDNDGDPIADVNISVEGTSLYAVTNGSGIYELDNVPAGEQVIKICKSGYGTVTITTYIYPLRTLASGAWEKNDITLPGYLPGGVSLDPLDGPYIKTTTEKLENGTVSGRVVLSSNDPSECGRPIENANVSVTASIGMKRWTLTDKTGNYTIENIAPGFAYIDLSIPAPNSTARGRAVVVVFVPPNGTVVRDFVINNNTLNRTIELTEAVIGESSGKISGTVRIAADNMGMSNAEVTLEPIIPFWYSSLDTDLNNITGYTLAAFSTTHTDAHGNYVFNNVHVGLYDLKVSQEGYKVTVIENISIVRNETMIQNITVEKLSDPMHFKADLGMLYTCGVLICLFSIIALLGGIMAIKRKKLGIAVIGALFGILSTGPIWLFELVPINWLLGSIALLIIIYAKKEFGVQRERFYIE